MEGFLDLFVTYLRAERGLSGKTVDAYAADLTAYFRDLAVRGVSGLSEITQEHVAGHLRALGEKGLGKRSQARHLAALRSFHRFLVSEKLVGQDPTEDLDTPRGPKKLPLFLTLEEVEALLLAPDPKVPAGARDRARGAGAGLQPRRFAVGRNSAGVRRVAAGEPRVPRRRRPHPGRRLRAALERGDRGDRENRDRKSVV